MIFSIPILLLVFSGLPWSALMGKEMGNIAREHYSLGYPALYVNPPKSDVEDLPWGTQGENPPATKVGDTSLTIEQMEAAVQKMNISRPYVMKLPADETGVYTIFKSSSSGITGMNVTPSQVITAYFNQYTGQLISKIDYHDYGVLAKWVTYGIPLHSTA
jgi:sulfite reductase (NADPH) flavoprotein alpha-component